MAAETNNKITYHIFLSIITGASAGLIGTAFQKSIFWISEFRIFLLNHAGNTSVTAHLIAAIFSIIFLVASLYLIRKFAPEAAGSGIQEIEGVLSNRRIHNWKKILPVKFISGVFSLSSGLVLGREGPTIQLSGTIGEMIGSLLKIDEEISHSLIAAGAGTGLAVAFNAPLAGILFVIEEMRPHFKYSFMTVQSVIISCAVGTLVLRIFMGQNPDISMIQLPEVELPSLWIFLILGSAFGLLGVIFNRVLVFFLDFYSSLNSRNYWTCIVIAGALMGILYLDCPEIAGGGYYIVHKALFMQIPAATLLLIFISRLFTTWFSYGTGTAGGIFAPMIAIGTLFGMWFGHFACILFPHISHYPQAYAVAGMSALFTASVGAPLTGIVLVIEMTSNYNLILPLIITCFSSALIAKLLNGRPIYEILLERTLKQNIKTGAAHE